MNLHLEWIGADATHVASIAEEKSVITQGDLSPLRSVC